MDPSNTRSFNNNNAYRYYDEDAERRRGYTANGREVSGRAPEGYQGARMQPSNSPYLDGDYVGYTRNTPGTAEHFTGHDGPYPDNQNPSNRTYAADPSYHARQVPSEHDFEETNDTYESSVYANPDESSSFTPDESMRWVNHDNDNMHSPWDRGTQARNSSHDVAFAGVAFESPGTPASEISIPGYPPSGRYEERHGSHGRQSSGAHTAQHGPARAPTDRTSASAPTAPARQQRRRHRDSRPTQTR